MARSPLALLRGSDGRSLARALACLLLLNAIVVGFHSGSLAAAPDTVICSAFAGDGAAPAPAGDDHPPSCCLSGCVSSAAALPPPEGTGLVRPPHLVPAPLHDAVAIAPSPHRDAVSARGPPVLA
jgi:hypothetical protein